jgi:hypothetical protein
LVREARKRIEPLRSGWNAITLEAKPANFLSHRVPGPEIRSQFPVIQGLYFTPFSPIERR